MADESDSSVEEARKAIVLARLAAAEASRKADRDKRKEEASSLTDPRESIAQYLAEFSSLTTAMQSELQAVLDMPETQRDAKQIQGQLDDLTARAFQVRFMQANVGCAWLPGNLTCT